MTSDVPSVPGVQHQLVTLPSGVRLHVAHAGEGDPVLLLHGWPQHWYCWRDVTPSLAERYRVLMPDLRGFGWSDAPGTGYDVPTFVADIVALLDALEIRTVKLVGHDWGGFTTFLLALGHPERVERALVVNSPHPWARPSLKLLAEGWRLWYVLLNASPLLGPAAVTHTSYVPWLLRRPGRGALYSSADAAIYADRLAEPARARATQALYRYYLKVATTVLSTPSFNSQRLTVPTRLLFGIDDFLISTAYMPGGEGHGDDFEIELVPGCGHFMPEERPELVVQKALELFAG